MLQAAHRNVKLAAVASETPRLEPYKGPGPKVSAVMPTFRRAHVIGDTIRCLLDGEWSDLELIVQDDGDGMDGTPEAVFKAAKGDPRVVYHRNAKKLGIPGNLNEAIRHTRGELIAMCHDHDVYKPAFLRKMVEALERYRTALFVHCAIDTITQSGEYVRSFINDFAELTPGDEWLQVMLGTLSCQVCALTLVRRSAHEKYGLYDPRFDFVSDVELWMRLCTKGDVAYVAEPLIQVRERERGHYATDNALKLILATAAIHRRYLALAYRSLALIGHRLGLEVAVGTSVAQLKASRARRRAHYLLSGNPQR